MTTGTYPVRCGAPAAAPAVSRWLGLIKWVLAIPSPP